MAMNITPPTIERTPQRNSRGDQPVRAKKSRSTSSKHRTEAGKEAQLEKHSQKQGWKPLGLQET